ncbi:MAG TPA: D-alanyl-D-alanine carboxypeptidase family protein [Croceibacterium sp.]
MKRFFGIVATLAVAALAATAAPADAPVEPITGPAPVDPAIPVALLVDLSTGQTLFSREPDRRFMPASVTKVMTLYTAFDLIQRGKLSLDKEATFDKELADQWQDVGSSLLLKEGDRVTVGELLMGVATVSANDGAVTLAKAGAGSVENWVALMNDNAARLGMHDSHFGRPNGYMDEGRTYTTAHDLVLLADALTRRFPDLYQRFIGHHGMTYNGITQNNHDPDIGVVPGADGIKTGFTEQAGYTYLGSAVRDGRRLAMVIAGSPSWQIRNHTARELIEWGFDNFSTRELLPAGSPVGTAAVQGGAATSVPLRTETNVFANLANAGAGKAQLSLRYRGPLKAPIAEGEEVATLRVAVPGQQPHDVALVAASAVAKAKAWQRLRNGLEGLF